MKVTDAAKGGHVGQVLEALGMIQGAAVTACQPFASYATNCATDDQIEAECRRRLAALGVGEGSPVTYATLRKMVYVELQVLLQHMDRHGGAEGKS